MSKSRTTAHEKRVVIASALCDAVNYPGTWEKLHRDGQTAWLHRADKVTRELAGREHVIVSLDELDVVSEAEGRCGGTDHGELCSMTAKPETTIETYAGGFVARRGSVFLASGVTREDVARKMDAKPETTIPQAVAIAFHHWTGRAVIALGMLIRPWLDAEFAHTAMLQAIRWTWWRPGD